MQINLYFNHMIFFIRFSLTVYFFLTLSLSADWVDDVELVGVISGCWSVCGSV